MDDEHALTRRTELARAAGAAGASGEVPVAERAAVPVRAAEDALHVRRVFGEPRTVGAVTIVPVAKVAGGSGMGFGSGTDAERGGGDGGGGGFGVSARALGVYEIRDGKVAFRPAVDVTRLGGQALGAAAVLALAWVLRGRRG